MKKIDLLKSCRFGERVAEEEQETLGSYFVETDTWKQLLNGELDVIYGAKGAGKSALYYYLLGKSDSFAEKNILLVAAEELRGDPVFRQVLHNTAINEEEFRYLWLIYITSLIGSQLAGLTNKSEQTSLFLARLQKDGLLDNLGLRRILSNVRDYVKDIFGRVQQIDGGLKIDPVTGMPLFNGSIVFHEPTKTERTQGFISIFDLIDMAQDALKSQNLEVWIMFDRLDISFADSPGLEAVALRTLFRTYNDLRSKDKIKLKIFIRDDIWERVTAETGFREGSHITKQVTIRWNEQDLLHMLVSRILDNDDISKYFDVNVSEVLADTKKQEELFYRIFPDQVETGNNPKTFLWMVGRVKDGLGISAPRELIHLLNESRLAQIRQLEKGTLEDSFPEVINRTALKEALVEVSIVRIRQTLYTEFPGLKQFIEKLQEHKTEQDIKTLSKIFGLTAKETAKLVRQLVAIGFFEERRDKASGAITYWTPFLYREGLNMIQGREA